MTDQFGRTAKWLARQLDERLAEHGRSTPRSKLLAVIADAGPIRLGDAAVAVGVTQGTGSMLADGLVAEGLVRREQEPSDGRVTLLAVTPEGAVRAAAWFASYRAVTEELLAPLLPEQRRQLVQILHRLYSG